MDIQALKRASYISQALAVETGSLLQENWKNAFTTKKKDIRDISTQFDLKIEKIISSSLIEEFPNHGFVLEEESNINPESEFQWIIDPIDGTKYFGSLIPLFTISIGLLHHNFPILGTIYNPISNQIYWSYQGLGSIYCNNDRIEKGKIIKNPYPILSLDLSKLNELKGINESKWIRDKFTLLMKSFYRVRAFGQGSLSLAWLCLGAFDLYLDLTGFTKTVDIVGGLALLTEFGGKHEFIDIGDGRKRILAAMDQNLLDKAKNILLS